MAPWDDDADETEEMAEKGQVILKESQYLVPSPLDKLAAVTYEEAKALLRANEHGVLHFFREKECEEIGERLFKSGVVGSSLHLLSAANVEKDLGLNLGQQLALKAFIKRLAYVEKGVRRRDKIFHVHEFQKSRVRVPRQGCCPSWCCCLRWLCCCCCCHGNNEEEEEEEDYVGPPVWGLPRSRYGLTTDSLRLVTTEWADDGTRDDKERKLIGGCCGCCGHLEDDPPQYKTTTDNIDLRTIEDVDNFRLSSIMEKHRPSCYERCWGYHDVKVVFPANVQVTYVDMGDPSKEPQRKMKALCVDPERAEQIQNQIIAAMEDSHATAADLTEKSL